MARIMFHKSRPISGNAISFVRRGRVTYAFTCLDRRVFADRRAGQKRQCVEVEVVGVGCRFVDGLKGFAGSEVRSIRMVDSVRSFAS